MGNKSSTSTGSLIDQFNKVAQTAQSQSCAPGSECDKLATSEKLEQQYVEAKTTVATAPATLKKAEKAYYTYTKGTSGYNSIISDSLEKSAGTIVDDIKNKINANIISASNLNSNFASLSMSYGNVYELFQTYMTDVIKLIEKLNEKGIDMVTNDRKTYYETQNNDILIVWYKLWMWLYFILFIIFIIALLFSKTTMSIWSKLLLVILLGAYPYYISYVLSFLYKLGKSIKDLMPNNVYKTL